MTRGTSAESRGCCATLPAILRVYSFSKNEVHFVWVGEGGGAGGALLTCLSCAVGDIPQSVVTVGGSWSGQWQCPKAGGSGSCLHLDSPACLELGAVGKAWQMKGAKVLMLRNFKEVAGEEKVTGERPGCWIDGPWGHQSHPGKWQDSGRERQGQGPGTKK